MTSDLRPKSIGDIFDASFDLYKRNFALFAGIVAIVHIPAQIAFAFAILSTDMDKLSGTSRGPEQVDLVFAILGVLMLASMAYHFLFVVHSGALSIAVTERILGRPITIGEAYRRMRPKLFKLLVTWLIIDVVVAVVGFVVVFALSIVLSIVLAMVAGASMSAGANAGGALFTTVTIVAVIIMFLAYMVVLTWSGVFTTHAVTIENVGYFNALSRNWNLLKGRFWAPFWTTSLLALFVFGLNAAIQKSMEFIFGLTLYSWMPLSRLTHHIINQTSSTIISLFLLPFMIITLTVLYLDQRVRREGFDIEVELYEREARTSLEAAG